MCKVLIVGNPNVGKSTLFNTLAGERISIVKDYPGVTRDRIYADVEWLNNKFTIILLIAIPYTPKFKDIGRLETKNKSKINSWRQL